MFRTLILLFIAIPLIELYLLLVVGDWIGAWPTVGLVIVTGVIGATLARMQGLKVFGDIQFDLSVGNVPTDNLLSGALVLAAGLLLITPGLLTDVAGFAMLVPSVRRRIVARAKVYASKHVRML